VLGTASADAASHLNIQWIYQLESHIAACWQLPNGVTDKTKIAARVLVTFNPDGSLARAPELVDVTQHPQGPAYATSVLVAITRCAPYAFLPAENYKNGWDKLDMIFSGDPAAGQELQENLLRKIREKQRSERREKGN
jgi:hypothetical protein